MDTLFIGQNKIVLDTIDSTNNFAANLIKQTNVIEGTVILSDNQTKGKGQKGNTWISAPNLNLTFSLVVRPNFVSIKDQFYVSKITGLALIATLNDFNIDAIIKWPNDILVNNKKISGVLIENSIQGQKLDTCIIGVGLNVNQTDFGKFTTATSISLESGTLINRDNVLNTFYKHFEIQYLNLKKSKIQLIDDLYHANLYLIDVWSKFEDKKGAFNGKIIEVLPTGQIKIERENGTNSFYFLKEVKFL